MILLRIWNFEVEIHVKFYMDIKQIEDFGNHIPKEKLEDTYISTLLNVVGDLIQEVRNLREENQTLKDEIRKLKNEKGKPNIKGNKKSKNSLETSSEKERKDHKLHKKTKKKENLKIHRTEVRQLDKNILPSDAQFKGYKDIIIQNIKVIPDNICFKLEQWYSPSEKKTYQASIVFAQYRWVNNI